MDVFRVNKFYTKHVSIWTVLKNGSKIYINIFQIRSRDISVGIATEGRVKNFLFSTSSRPVLESTQPPIQWVSRALLPGVKRPGREADRSPSAIAEVKKMWTYTSTPPYVFIA
jgi:hypothetical protein